MVPILSSKASRGGLVKLDQGCWGRGATVYWRRVEYAVSVSTKATVPAFLCSWLVSAG
jgi:hypothetical protein